MKRLVKATRGERGQATIELLGLIPLSVTIGSAVFCILAAGQAREVAGHAAGAGAVALLQDADPAAAARRAIGDSAGSFEVAVHGRVVTVEASPRLPIRSLSAMLTATRSADAGPEPSP